MGKNQEERKTPVIVVKKRRTFSLPSLSEKTDIIAPVFTEQTAESAPAGINSSAVETHIPEAPARKKKKKRRHCCKVSDEAAFCLIQRPYISKTLLTRRISPRGSP